MLGMDLSSLNVAELRRVLEAARARNQADLAAQLLAELQSRRAEPGVWLGRSPGDDGAPRALDDRWDEPVEADARERDPPSRAVVMAGALVGLVLACGLGWWGTVALRAPPPPPPPPPAQRAQVVRTLVAPPLSKVPATAEATPPPEVASASSEAAAARPVRPAPASPPAGPRANDCRSQATPADRLVCRYPMLARQHQRLQAAYAEALAAGADAREIDQGQAEWRATRDQTTDRHVLGQLYDARIAELEAEAAHARDVEPVF